MTESSWGTVRLEQLRFRTQKLWHEAGMGSALDVEFIQEHALHAMRIELCAAVSASVNEEWWEDKFILAPERPVRDGALLWISRHSGPLSGWFKRRAKQMKIPMMTKHTVYHGCPHVNLPGTDDRLHWQWLTVREGGQES